MNKADLEQGENDTPNSCDTMWMGSEHNLGVRVERPLSGPIIEAILEPRCEQEEHRAFLEEDI